MMLLWKPVPQEWLFIDEIIITTTYQLLIFAKIYYVGRSQRQVIEPQFKTPFHSTAESSSLDKTSARKLWTRRPNETFIFSFDKVKPNARTPNALIVSIVWFRFYEEKKPISFHAVIRPQTASTESSEDSNFMLLTMLAILAFTLYVFRPMGRRRQLANSNKSSSSGEVIRW